MGSKAPTHCPTPEYIRKPQTDVAAFKDKLTAAFTEWERRYRETPEQFQSDFERFTNSASSYGTACAEYLLTLLK